MGDSNTHCKEGLRAGATMIPVLCLSDGTQLTNLSRDTKAWPVYRTIGNILSGTGNKPTNMAMILVALLPIPPKLTGGSSADSHPREANRVILCDVLSILFEDIKKVGMIAGWLACADAQYRMCYPMLCA
jgi:hypothetical protein